MLTRLTPVATLLMIQSVIHRWHQTNVNGSSAAKAPLLARLPMLAGRKISCLDIPACYAAIVREVT